MNKRSTAALLRLQPSQALPKPVPAKLLDALLPAVRCALDGYWLAWWPALGLDAIALGLVARNAELAVALAVGARLLFLAVKPWLASLYALEGGHAANRAASVAGVLAYIAVLTVQALALLPEIHALFAAFPAQLTWSGALESAIDHGVDAVTARFAGPFAGLTRAMNGLLNLLQAALGLVPWPLAMIALVFLAWRRGGLRFAVFTAATLVYFGVFGFWSKTVETLAVVLASFVVCLVVGIPLGVAAAKSRLVKAIVMPCLDVMQTMPSFVYLLPAVAFFSIGKPPALISTVIFAVPPLIRLTCLGIEQVPHVVCEAMYAHGATAWQSLVKAELPLAAPSIRAGINQTIMLSLAMAVIASLIGAGGLGYDVLFALQNVQYGKGILAGLAIVLSAIVFDRLVKSRDGR